ncbi:MAG: hypothetical protein K5780_00055 [Alphaproteobacteria bacterium]|nr:hypothetical protein [Alphaproteobacteria bacterium]
MRYLFLLLQLFFISSVAELFADPPTFASSMINNFLSNRTLTNDSPSGNQFGNYDQNRIYNTFQVSNDPGRTYNRGNQFGNYDQNRMYNAFQVSGDPGNNGDVLAPVQPSNTDYDRIFQSAENYIKNGGELDPKLFLDENLDSEAMSASDAENSSTLKRLLQRYQNLTNNPEIQRDAEENSPEAQLQELKKIREDLQITVYNLYRMLVNDPSILNDEPLKDTIVPLRNKEKEKINKRVGNLNFLLDALNLMIRHLKYPNLYFKSKESMPFGDIWGTSIGGNEPTITVATMQNSNSAPENNDAQNTGSATNSDSNNNDAQNTENEENENNESEQNNNSEADANNNNAENQPPEANDAVQNDDDEEDGADEAVRPSNDRISNDDDGIGMGGIIGGVVGVGGIGAALMLNSDPIEPEYDKDFYRQPTKKQAVEDEVKNPATDSQPAAQEAKEQAVQEENNQGDEEENDSEDSSSDEKTEVSKKDSAATDSDNESIADSGYDSDSEDTEADEDEEISEQSKTSARTAQTSQSKRTNQQMRQISGKQSVQRNSASASRQNFEQTNEFETFGENSGISGKDSARVYASDSSVEDYIHDSDVEDYIYGSGSSVEDYIRSETDPYWNESDQYSTSSVGLYNGYQLVPTNSDRLRRYKSLDDELLHADEF